MKCSFLAMPLDTQSAHTVESALSFHDLFAVCHAALQYNMVNISMGPLR
jgi:hypothetical protein